MNKYFPIDCTKLVLAVVIVLLHTNSFLPGGDIALQRAFYNLAVPLFFCFSGFFFARNVDFKKSLRHLTALYLIWTLVLFPLGYFRFRDLTLAEAIINLLTSGFIPTGWFIVALVQCMGLTALIWEIRNKRAAAALLAIAGLICFAYCSLYNPYSHTEAGALLNTDDGMAGFIFLRLFWSFPRGMLYFVTGFAFMRLNIRVSRNVAWAAVAVTLAAFVAESVHDIAAYHLNDVFEPLSKPLLVGALMALLLAYSRPAPLVTAGKMCRESSTMLYMAHPIIIYLLDKTTGIKLGWTATAMVLAVFALMFYVYLLLRDRKGFGFLKYAT